jgi:hypothetical protein
LKIIEGEKGVMVREMTREQPPEPLDFFIWTVEVTKFEALSVSPVGFLVFLLIISHSIK